MPNKNKKRPGRARGRARGAVPYMPQEPGPNHQPNRRNRQPAQRAPEAVDAAGNLGGNARQPEEVQAQNHMEVAQHSGEEREETGQEGAQAGVDRDGAGNSGGNASQPEEVQAQNHIEVDQHSGEEREETGQEGAQAGVHRDGASAEMHPAAARFIEQNDMIRTRPKTCIDKAGESGKKVLLVTNYFRLVTTPDWLLYQYRVTFTPEVESPQLRKRLLYQHVDLLGGTRAFDGTILFLPRRLPKDEIELVSFMHNRETEVKLIIRLTNELPPDSPVVIQMYNIIFRRVMQMLGMKQLGRWMYNERQAVNVARHKLSVWPGFVSTIRPYEQQQTLLCLDVIHKVLRTETVLEMLQSLYAKDKHNFHENAGRMLLGQIVLTKYNKFRTYRIDDICWEQCPNSKFEKQDGTSISYIDYYRERYGIMIVNKEQCLLVTKTSKRHLRAGQPEIILLVPELCTLTGLSDEARKDLQLMRDVTSHTRLNPEQRVGDLKRFQRGIMESDDARKEMENWQLSVSDKLVEVEGRVLSSESIITRISGPKMCTAEWRDILRKRFIVHPVPMRHWIFIAPGDRRGEARELVQNIQQTAYTMGFQIDQPEEVYTDRNTTADYLRKLRNHQNPSSQLVMCLLTSCIKEKYDAIKRHCCVTNPVLSQVASVTTWKGNPKLLKSVAANIAAQMAAKLGSELWQVEIPLSYLMVVGIDVWHDKSSKKDSVVGFVSSLNKTLTKYHSRATFQVAKEEIVVRVRTLLLGALKRYYEVNERPPSHIVIYRDGVGDGQLAQVYETELKQALAGIEDFGGSFSDNYKPQLLYVVVKKRINTRLFTPDMKNVATGTIVDTVITNPAWYDFFLVSQKTMQGTVSPTHYNVIWNTSQLSPDKVQRLTYKLTYLYYNWTGTIRVPAPCQYAHKLAFIVGQSLNEEPARALADYLWYL